MSVARCFFLIFCSLGSLKCKTHCHIRGAVHQDSSIHRPAPSNCLLPGHSAPKTEPVSPQTPHAFNSCVYRFVLVQCFTSVNSLCCNYKYVLRMAASLGVEVRKVWKNYLLTIKMAMVPTDPLLYPCIWRCLKIRDISKGNKQPPGKMVGCIKPLDFWAQRFKRRELHQKRPEARWSDTKQHLLRCLGETVARQINKPRCGIRTPLSLMFLLCLLYCVVVVVVVEISVDDPDQHQIATVLM